MSFTNTIILVCVVNIFWILLNLIEILLITKFKKIFKVLLIISLISLCVGLLIAIFAIEIIAWVIGIQASLVILNAIWARLSWFFYKNGNEIKNS